MVAIVLSEELQEVEARVCVLLSLNVPVAMKGWTALTVSDGLAGLTAIETRPVGSRLAG
jgi:hypothetical protein